MIELRRTLALLLAATSPLLSPLAAEAQQPVRPLPAPDAIFDEPFTLVAAGNVRELRDGRLIVADARDKVVRLLDFRTGRATSIGREGSGPAEFGLPMRLFAAPGDSSFIFDPLNQRYLVLAPDGKPATTFRMETPTAGGMRDRMRMGLSIARATDARGRLYYESPASGVGPDGRSQPADSAAVLRHDRVAKKSDTLAWVKLAKGNTQVTGGGNNMSVRIGMANPLEPRDEWTVFPDGRVAIVRASDYHVDWVMPNGATQSAAAIRFTPLRVTEADKKEEEAVRARAMQGAVMISMANGPGGMQRSASVGRPAAGPPPEPLTDWPEVKPPFRSGSSSVWARPNGELWVRRTEAAGAKGTLYDVIDARGAVTHSVRVPEGLSLVGFGNGTLYTTKLDEDDLQYVQRHRIN